MTVYSYPILILIALKILHEKVTAII